MAERLVKPLRMDEEQDPASEYAIPLLSGTDGIGASGFFPQSAASFDQLAGVERDANGNLTFKDAVLGTTKTLTQLSTGGTGITEETHKALRQLIHFIDGGPAEGFATGAYREVTGTAFPTAVIWWTSAAKTLKIVEKLLTYTGAFPTTIVWKVYSAAGVVLATVTDTISYSGAFETSRTRAIA